MASPPKESQKTTKHMIAPHFGYNTINEIGAQLQEKDDILQEDDEDFDEISSDTEAHTEFRLGVVGITFIVAGALVLIVPGVLHTYDNELDSGQPERHYSAGYLSTGGVLLGLGGLMIIVNIAWCLNEQRILRDIDRAREKESGNRLGPLEHILNSSTENARKETYVQATNRGKYTTIMIAGEIYSCVNEQDVRNASPAKMSQKHKEHHDSPNGKVRTPGVGSSKPRLDTVVQEDSVAKQPSVDDQAGKQSPELGDIDSSEVLQEQSSPDSAYSRRSNVFDNPSYMSDTPV